MGSWSDMCQSDFERDFVRLSAVYGRWTSVLYGIVLAYRALLVA